MPATRDLVSDDPAIVATTIEHLHGCIDAAARVGAGVVSGPIYASVGRLWLLDADERRATIARLVANLRPLADEAAGRGVVLALEPLNRFESSLINTVDQALEVVDAVDSPGLGVALDTFHMSIEEKNLAAAIVRAGPKLAHFQASGSDRGAPGNDHLDWPAIAEAIVQVDYDGPICIESFTSENAAIARSAAIWRPLERSQDAIATDGIAFLRELLAGVAGRPTPTG